MIGLLKKQTFLEPDDMRQTVRKNGFTLVELMVALIVTGIIMSAIATLVFAFGSAYDASNDTDRKQAQVRYASLRISELIRHCKLICGTPDNSIVIWKADDNPQNDEIEIIELAYIDMGSDGDRISIIEFSSCPDWLSSWWSGIKLRDLELWELQQSDIKALLLSRCETTEIEVITECSNGQFKLFSSDDVEITEVEEVPNSRFVNISFDLRENEVVRQYHIDSALRCWAGHQISVDGRGIIDDDD